MQRPRTQSALLLFGEHTTNSNRQHGERGCVGDAVEQKVKVRGLLGIQWVIHLEWLPHCIGWQVWNMAGECWLEYLDAMAFSLSNKNLLAVNKPLVTKQIASFCNIKRLRIFCLCLGWIELLSGLIYVVLHVSGNVKGSGGRCALCMWGEVMKWNWKSTRYVSCSCLGSSFEHSPSVIGHSFHSIISSW